MANEVKSVWPAAIAIICVIILSSLLAITAINNNSKDNAEKPVNIALNLTDVTNAIEDLSDKIDTTSNANDAVDKLCYLTDGCQFYKPTESETNRLLSILTSKITSSNRDFIKVVSALTGVDKDYLEFTVLDTTFNDESQVRAATLTDKKEGNWVVQTLVKVKYYDSDREDSDDTNTLYVLVQSTLDEGEYDSMTGTKVTRDFVFE